MKYAKDLTRQYCVLKQCVTIGVLSMNDDMECEKDYSKIQVLHTK